MKTKKVFFSELAYALGILALAFGTALMERADFGLSMVVAPAYLLHLKLSQTIEVFSFGMAEYCLQAALLIALCLILRRGKAAYLFSFVTAVIYGYSLDAMMALAGLLPQAGIAMRIACYLFGMGFCAAGVSLLFHTYISPEAYELFVKEIAAQTGKAIPFVKTVYDCASCLAGVAMSFAFFGVGRFEGVKLGTILCALVNGFLIGRCSAFFEAIFDFKDALPLRGRFEA